jgi:hypothetical protein
MLLKPGFWSNLFFRTEKIQGENTSKAVQNINDLESVAA